MKNSPNYPVNLPQTDFDMRAGLVNKEPKILEQWAAIDLYKQRTLQDLNKIKFILHDGPPYANGDIHMGTALNKILKDVICRYKYTQGFTISFVPGWDCHGLPIEQNTLKSLKKSAHDLSVQELCQHSRKYAMDFVSKQKDSFIRLGIMADWDNAYLTMSKEYTASILETFGILLEKSYIYRGSRPIYWSPESGTALADAEVEYHEHTSPSIYVLFPIKNPEILNLGKFSYVMIWTTTPWTLPSNTAVAFHPEEFYEALTLDSGFTIIVASKLKEKILALKNEKVLTSKLLSRSDIEQLSVYHPWIKRTSQVVFAEYVTMDSGTGIVHTAPGHGMDDYQTGLKYGLDILSPINDLGQFTEDVPEWQGLNIFKANPEIVTFLKKINALYFDTTISHSYPHDWRTKTPLIFRTKPQWFFKVSDHKLHQAALNAVSSVKWIPSWGEDRIRHMLSDRPDWCISRQRKWGAPIPVFYCEHCSYIHKSRDLAFHIASKVRELGIEYWFNTAANEILPQDMKCPDCNKNDFVKEEDILDVWFDSGNSHYAVLDKRNEFPADLYFEGNDQYRGWFQSSIWNSIATKGLLPFCTILTHGWVLDEHGHQMHKSAGNAVSPSLVIDKFGADILRLWTVTEDFSKDLRIGDNIIQKTVDLYRKLRNTFRYLLGSLFDYNESNCLPYSELTSLDRYMLHKLSNLYQEFKTYMDEYQIHRAYRAVFNFAIIDLSGEYFDILKDRLYILLPNDPLRRSAQTTLYYILKLLNSILSPVLIFTTEEIYSHRKSKDKKKSVHLIDHFEISKKWNQPELAKDFKMLYNLRIEALKTLQKLRDEKVIGSSLDAKIEISCDSKMFLVLKKYLSDLTEMLIVSDIEIKDTGSRFVLSASKAISNDKIRCERCWKIRKKTHGDICEKCADIVKKIQ